MIELTNVSFAYESKPIFQKINLSLEGNEIISIVGPNGSGKTTLLNLISRNKKPEEGKVALSIEENEISFIKQDYRKSLLPWKTAYNNIILPLRIMGLTRDKCNKRLDSLTCNLNIDFSLYQFPYSLSGGQQQLVGILRGIITNPKLLLLDEPFSALDYKRRMQIRKHLKSIHEINRPTIIIVTHELEEAILLSDKILLVGKPPISNIDVISVSSHKEKGLLNEKRYLSIKERLSAVLEA